MMRILTIRSYVLLSCFFLILQSCSDEVIDNSLLPESESEEIVSDPITSLIVDWNKLWCELDRYAVGMRPNASTRALAYIHLAAYEVCVADMENFSSNNNRFEALEIESSQRASVIHTGIALNACYAATLNHFMYNVPVTSQNKIALLLQEKEFELTENVDENVILDSKAWGNYVAQQVIAFSQTDVAAETQISEPQPLSYEPPIGLGYWSYTDDAERALFPYWSSVRTFVISSEETTSVTPELVYSETQESAYYQAMHEVYTASENARINDDESLWIAEFWSNDVEGLMMSPPGRQISIANQLLYQYDVSHEDAVVLLLKLGFSLNDAAVSTWADKYEYMVMRPSVYIQSHIDENFQTNLYPHIYWPNPSFPSYPSGHSSFASAAAGIFIHHFGDQTDFTDRTHDGRTEFRGNARHFDTFSEMAAENAYSRIPLGVHLRMDCTEGLRLGYEISNAVNNFDLSQ